MLQTQKNVKKLLKKTKKQNSNRNGNSHKTVMESNGRRKSPWWERFLEKVNFKLEVTREGVINVARGDSTNKVAVMEEEK